MLTARTRLRLAEWILLLSIVVVVLWKGGKSLDATWLLGAVAVVLTFLGTARQHLHRGIWIAWTGFLGWSILSFLFSTVQNYGLDELIRDASIFLVFCWVARHPSRDAFVRTFSSLLTTAGIIAVAIGVMVYIGQPVSRFVGTFFDWRFHTDYWPNAWADLVLLAWPIAAFTLRRRLIPLGLALGALWGSLFLSYSRGGILAFAAQIGLVSVVLCVWMMHRSLKLNRRTVQRFVVPVLLGMLTAAILFFSANALRSQSFAIESIGNKATFTATEGTSSVSERRQFWDAAIAMTLERPLTGWGPYAFRFVQPQYQSSVLATADHPHNIFLKVAAERGIPALVAFASILFLILLPVAQTVAWKKKVIDPVRTWTLAVFLSVIGVLLHSLIDYNLQFVGIALPFWVAIATIVPVSDRSDTRNRFIERFGAAVLVLVLIIEGAFLFTSSLGRHAAAQGDDETAVFWFEMSRRETFSRDLGLSLASLSQQKDDAEKAEQELQQYLTRNTHDARAWLMLGNLQESEQQYEQALRSYEMAWKNGRYNILNVLSGFLRIAVETNDHAFLESHREEFISTFEAYAQSILMNTHFIALSATVEELQHVSAYMIRAYPDHAARIREFTKEAALHAVDERSQYKERTPGLLW